MAEQVNYSLDPAKKEGTTETNEKGEVTGKSRMIMIILLVVGLLLLVIVLWLAIGWGMDHSDQVSCKDDLDKKEKTIQVLNKTVSELKAANAALVKEVKDVLGRIEILIEDNKELKQRAAHLEMEIEVLNKNITDRDRIINKLRNELDRLNETIAELNDNVEELYADMRLIVGILNQELNRNQGLIKEIDYLEGRIEEYKTIISNQDAKIYGLMEQLEKLDESYSVQWLRAEILESLSNKKVSLKQIYSGSALSCNKGDFHKTVDTVSPNAYIAKERETGYAFGGFSSQNWKVEENEYKKDKYAFTFSVKNSGRCTLINEDHAIKVKNDTTPLLLGHGEDDIFIANNCINETNHKVQVGKTYNCPKNENFYTLSKTPKLTSFSFYEVKIDPPLTDA